jgi:hypothetical protein
MVSMINDDGSAIGGPPPPGDQTSGHQPSGHPPQGFPPQASGYPPPGYPPPGYPPPGYAGYGPPQGYGPPGYPPPGYGSAGYGPGYAGSPYGPPPGAFKPGVIPLRPLSLSDIFNGAVSYIRANPKATLGLTTIVVVAAQLLTLILTAGPFAFSGQLEPTLSGQEVSTGVLVGSSVSSLAGLAATGLSSILLSGLLTVVVGRAVFGAGITIGEAWQRLRARFWALLGFSVLEVLGAIVLVAIVVGLIFWIAVAGGGIAAVVIGIPLVLGLAAALVYLGTILTFAPAIIVLERLDIVAAVQRSFALVKRDFWRILGIRVLAVLVAQLIASAVAIPFSFGGQILLLAASSTSVMLIALMLLSIGSAVSQIITAPFSAGVVVLQYTDSRIRSEAFDLVLQTGAAYGPAAAPESTDHLWLIRHP